MPEANAGGLAQAEQRKKVGDLCSGVKDWFFPTFLVRCHGCQVSLGLCAVALEAVVLVAGSGCADVAFLSGVWILAKAGAASSWGNYRVYDPD